MLEHEQCCEANISFLSVAQSCRISLLLLSVDSV